MNRKIFFDVVRKTITKRLKQTQVEGFTKVLDEWEKRGLTDDRWLANILAQSFWESGRTMQPVREFGGEEYLKSKKYYPWVGNGLIQVTWEENHRKFGATAPDQLLDWPLALAALFDGMINGMYTGKKLSTYFNNTVDDPINARRIVNGTDKAEDIADLHQRFLLAIRLAEKETKETDKDMPIAMLTGYKTYAAAGGLVLCVILETFLGVDIPGFETPENWTVVLLNALGLTGLRAAIANMGISSVLKSIKKK